MIADNQALLSGSIGLRESFARPYFPAAGRDHIYYRPLVNASYAADAAWTATDPLGYHVTNILLHALASALVFFLLRRMLPQQEGALFGALLFAVHPALTATAAWIPGRNDSLLAVFALSSWLFLLAAVPAPADGTASDSKAGAASNSISNAILTRLGHLTAWLCALFTKETALVLPVVYVVHLLWLERRPWRAVARPWLLGGWIGAGALYFVARRAVALGSGDGGNGGGGAFGATDAERVFSNLPLLVSSLGKLLLPIHLSVLATPQDSWLWPGFFALGALLLALFFISDRRRVVFGVGCVVAFLAPSLPASNLLVLENRLYLPGVGISLAIADVAGRLSWPPRVKVAVAGAIVALLALVSFSYSDDFRDRLSFAQAAVRQSPHSSLAHRNLGITYQIAGDTVRARREYEAALTQDAAEPIVHNNLGVIFMATGNLTDAERELRQELSFNPRYAQAHHNLALVLTATNRLDEAVKHWEHSLSLNPTDTEALRALITYYDSRAPSRAAHFRALLQAPRPIH
ncbi:MAG: tetratricopeptide repeat protein [Deltaproteobacteria bacterium]|nr:tetratricopeptide repeat protein [Deltaproteobacteria bacterium]